MSIWKIRDCYICNKHMWFLISLDLFSAKHLSKYYPEPTILIDFRPIYSDVFIRRHFIFGVNHRVNHSVKHSKRALEGRVATNMRWHHWPEVTSQQLRNHTPPSTSSLIIANHTPLTWPAGKLSSLSTNQWGGGPSLVPPPGQWSVLAQSESDWSTSPD